jgi:MinD-like ATPase involved in chromosome partitioning or flagellar assembly
MSSPRQRVTVVSPFGQQQMDLPVDAPVSAFLPDLLAMAGLSSAHPDPAGDGWQITDTAGALVAQHDTLAAHGIWAGATIQLRRAQPPQPSPVGGGGAVTDAVTGQEKQGYRVAPTIAPSEDGLTPLQRAEAVTPRPVRPVSRASAAISAFVRGPAQLAVADAASRRAANPAAPAEPQPGRHRLLPAELTVAAPPTRLECARAQWRDLDFISRLDSRIIAPRLHNCATIAVVSPKGGVGKTTITALLGTLLSMLRRDPIVAVDTNPDFGSLGRILTPDQSWYVDDLARLISEDEMLSLTSLDSRLGRAVHGLLVVPAPTDPLRMAALDQAAYQRLITRLQDFFSLIMLDCGTGLQDPASTAAIATAHQVLLLTDAQPATASLVAESADLLNQWGRPITVVVNRMPTRGNRLDLEQLSRHIPAARGLVVIPDDVAAATRLAGGNFHWRDAPANWQRALRRLAAVLVSDWERLGLSGAWAPPAHGSPRP